MCADEESWKVGPWKSIYKMDSNINTDANSVPAFLGCYKSLSYSRNSPKLYCRTHKGSPFVTILRQINPLHTLQSYLFNIHFNITVYLCLYFKSISFFQVSLPKSLWCNEPQGSPRTPTARIAATTPRLIVRILISVFFKLLKILNYSVILTRYRPAP